MQSTDDVVDILARMTLFADISRSQLEGLSHYFDEVSVEAGQRLLRKGFAGGGFSVILSGEAAVHVDGEQRMALAPGDFFGEISVLLDEAPTADVVAVTPMRCLVLSGQDLKRFLLQYPKVMFRLLQAMAQRLSRPFQWHG
ncbi:MAG TPA: cyclic nucleotide-binding domain-containing protein [Acidimicrobiales bacterium]|nr:cyclic nucleotide-binding domain-containing protein [Acidimicrobiales bacterium]